uniref:Uncharacterized protein n=1 Tax=Candidatus Kentrum sp. SD TaxID=2126332 RepID=A0A450Z143_9GAMM|nr:MAG: hypothetical protein BECKSD772F_GA0070984_10948 [Candidatus Kentron sp. SD]VFK47468.1 MAG: hypothetical protein BECKSD772E_GA0070983_10958 [Candidatus Kentron sp. SD]
MDDSPVRETLTNDQKIGGCPFERSEKSLALDVLFRLEDFSLPLEMTDRIEWRILVPVRSG